MVFRFVVCHFVQGFVRIPLHYYWFVFMLAVALVKAQNRSVAIDSKGNETVLNDTSPKGTNGARNVNSSDLIYEHLEAWRSSINYTRTKSPCFQRKTAKAVPNIMMIGDSIDRNSAMAWCQSRGVGNEAFAYGHTWRLKFPECSPFNATSHNRSMIYFQGIPGDKLDLRYYICEVPGYANVAFIFNELGVNTSRHCMNNLYMKKRRRKGDYPENMSSCIRESIGPIIDIVARSLGHVDLLVASSLFWDISRLHDQHKRAHRNPLFMDGGETGTMLRDKFLAEWLNNFSDFVETIQSISRTLNPPGAPAPPLVWRSHTKPAYQPNTSFWLNEYGTFMVRNMSETVLTLVKDYDIEVSPLHIFPGATQLVDHIHPNLKTLCAFVEYLLERAVVLGAGATPSYNNITWAEVREIAQEKALVVAEQWAIQERARKARKEKELASSRATALSRRAHRLKALMRTPAMSKTGPVSQKVLQSEMETRRTRAINAEAELAEVKEKINGTEGGVL
jgi:hypothetical protein